MSNVHYTPQLTEDNPIILLQYQVKWKQDFMKLICPDTFLVKIRKIQKGLRAIFQLILKCLLYLGNFNSWRQI